MREKTHLRSRQQFPQLQHCVKSRNQEKDKVASFDATDSTSKINATLWRQFAEFAHGLSPENQILLRNVYAKRGFAGQLELTTRATTKIEMLPDIEQDQAEFLFLKDHIICASQEWCYTIEEKPDFLASR
jgi:hypothetical protein